MKAFLPPLLLSHPLSLLRHILAPIQDLNRIIFISNVCPTLKPLISWRDNRWFDNGLLDAARNLQTAASPSPLPPTHPIKVLADKAPSSRARVGPLRATEDSPEFISDEGRAAVASNFWSKVWETRS